MKEYDRKADKEILDGIRKLTDYVCKVDGTEEMEKPIIVLAPKLGSSKPGEESKKLRVYAYGGLIGEIPTSQRQEASLAGKAYLEHLPENSKKKSRFEELLELSNSKPQKKEQVLHALFSDEYLDLAAEACRSKFTKEMGGSKERVIETNLVKKYLGNTDIWVPIDIEFLMPQAWLEDTEKRGKPDIILYDKRVSTFCLIELKYNNESCTGNNSLLNHYDNAMKIIHTSHRDKLVDEYFRKMSYLYEYGIINGEAWKEVSESPDRDKIDLKFGYFFIGGSLETYKECVKEQLGDTDKNCSFLYSPDIDTDTLKNCQMLSYEEFMR